MEKGQMVMIANTNSIWDGMEGVVEDVGEGKCTVLVDFSPNEGKKVRQDFSEECLAEIDGHVDAQSILGKGNGGKHMAHMAESKVHEALGQQSRKEALANFLGIDADDLNEGYKENVFEGEDGEWIVLTFDEAEDEAYTQIKEIFGDIGLDAFTEGFQDWIVSNAVDSNPIYDWMSEYYLGYAEDIENEGDPEFGNRLIQEMFSDGILTDDDFEVGEDGEADHHELKGDVDMDSKMDEFVEKLSGQEEPIEWLRNMYDEKQLAELLVDNGLIDVDIVAEKCVAEDGIAHFIATYDGEELELGQGLYGYRLN